MKITYKKATPDDIERLYQLNKSLIDAYESIATIDYDRVLRWVRKKIETCIDEYTAVYADDIKAGYYHFYKNDDEEYEIDDLYIFSEFQNQGIGSSIIEKCCGSVNETVMLYVFIKNEGAIALYKKFGFEIVQTIGSSRYIMQKS